MSASECIPVRVTAQQKARIALMAEAAGLKMGEFLRHAADAYIAPGEQAMLEGSIAQMTSSTKQASVAIDDALAFVDASNQRIATIAARRRQLVPFQSTAYHEQRR